MEQALKILEAVRARLGNVDLDTAVSWLRVEKNAQELREEGHEEEEKPAT